MVKHHMQPAEVTMSPGLRQKAILHRYMDLPKLLDLLHSKTLYLRRASGFSDRLEGVPFPAFRQQLEVPWKTFVASTALQHRCASLHWQ